MNTITNHPVLIRFEDLEVEKMCRVHHIAEADGMHSQPTEYISAPMPESQAVAKVAEIIARGVEAWKVEEQ